MKSWKLSEVIMKMTLFELLDNSVKKYGNRPSLSWADEKPLSYSELNYKIVNLKEILHKNGIVKGDRVALLGENSPNWGIGYLSVTTMGAVVVPILTEFHRNEIMHILRHSGAKAILVSDKLFNKIEDEISDLMNVVIRLDSLSLIKPETNKEKILKFFDDGKSEIARLKKSAMKFVGISSDELQEDDLASIVYTSGTTGHSKGVMLTHKNIVFDTKATLKIQNIVPTDKLISILPLAHTYECTIGFILPFSKGASIYYLKKPPTARVLLPAMQQIRPTMILTVPLIMEKIF